MSGRVHLGANVILRFLRNDDPKQSARAAALFQHAQAGDVVLLGSPVFLMEVFYVLSRTYKIDRVAAAKLLHTLLSSGAVVCDDGGITLDALQLITSNQISFGDAVLAATAARTQEPIASFDKGMTKFGNVSLFPIHTLPPTTKS